MKNQSKNSRELSGGIVLSFPRRIELTKLNLHVYQLVIGHVSFFFSIFKLEA